MCVCIFEFLPCIQIFFRISEICFPIPVNPVNLFPTHVVAIYHCHPHSVNKIQLIVFTYTENWFWTRSGIPVKKIWRFLSSEQFQMSNKTRIAWTIDEWFILMELIEVPIKKFGMQSLKNMIDNPSVRNTMLKWEWGPLLRSETENKKYSICVDRVLTKQF